MKKPVLTALVVFALLFPIFTAVQFSILAKANPSSMARLFDSVIITIQSPQNKTYNVRTIPLNFTVETNNDYQLPANYTLNSQKPIEITPSVVSSRIVNGTYGTIESNNVLVNHTFTYARFTAQGNAVLSNLADGTYNLTIQRYGNPAKPTVSNNVTFTIDTISPSIQILLPQNKTYDVANIPLIFTSSEPSTFSYSLDEKPNSAIAGNTTLALPEGSYNLVIYVEDAAGNKGKSAAVSFSVESTTVPTPTANLNPLQPTPNSSLRILGDSSNQTLFYAIAGIATFAIIVIIVSLSHFRSVRKRRIY